MANRATGERVFPASPDATRAAIAEALKELGWEWRPGPGGGISAVWTSRVFRFKDDVEIAVAPESGGRTRVNVRAQSRVGRYDWGQNARHVRDLFRATARAPSISSARPPGRDGR